MSLDVILGHFGTVKKAGKTHKVLCPIHGDRTPSLDIDLDPDGTVKMICRSCNANGFEVCDFLGIDRSELFPNGNGSPSGQKVRYRIEDATRRHRYNDEHGDLLYNVGVFPDGIGKTFRPFLPNGRQGFGERKVLYRLDELVASSGPVYLVEGEKDADTLVELGLTATTNPMGGGKLKNCDHSALTGRDVIVIGDNDDTGRAHVADVTQRLRSEAASITVVDLPGLEVKGDVTDWINNGGTVEKLQSLIAETQDTDSYQWDTDELMSVLSGEYTPPARGVLRREDGEGLFYAGQVHSIVAQPEAGKTLMAYVALGATDSQPVVLLDFEMGAVQAGERLKLLGVTVGDNWRYKYRPVLIDAVEAIPPNSIVVIDATDGGFAALDLNPNDTSDANKFDNQVTAPLKQKGCTVILLDHSSTAQHGGDRKRGAMGNTKKLGNADISLYMSVEQPGSPHHVGLYQLWVDKDRSAQLRGISHRSDGRDHLATMRTENIDGILAVQMLTPRPWRPTHYMEQVSRFLEGVDEPQSRNKIEEGVTGKAKTIGLATDLLVGDGYVKRTDGARNAKLHTSVMAYRQGTDPRIAPEDNTSSDLLPTSAGGGEGEATSTSSPPSQGGGGEVLTTQPDTTPLPPLPPGGRGRREHTSPVAVVKEWRGLVETVERHDGVTEVKVRNRPVAVFPSGSLVGPSFDAGDSVAITENGQPDAWVVDVTERAVPF